MLSFLPADLLSKRQGNCAVLLFGISEEREEQGFLPCGLLAWWLFCCKIRQNIWDNIYFTFELSACFIFFSSRIDTLAFTLFTYHDLSEGDAFHLGVVCDVVGQQTGGFCQGQTSEMLAVGKGAITHRLHATWDSYVDEPVATVECIGIDGL